MGDKGRYVVVSVLLLAFLAGLALSHGLNWVFVRQGWDDPFLFSIRQLQLSSVIAFSLMVVAVAFILKHGPTYQFCLEVVDELSKVTWPSREETSHATVVVVVTVVVCSLYLGAFDAVWLWFTDLVLGTTG